MTTENPAHTTAQPTEVLIRGRAAFTDALAAVMQRAQRELRVSVPFLDPAIFNSGAAAQALSGFVLRHPRQKAMLLIRDVARSARESGRFAELAHRLSDRIEVRTHGHADDATIELFVVADRAHHLWAEDASRLEGILRSDDIFKTREFIDRFDAAWEQSEPVALKPLGL